MTLITHTISVAVMIICPVLASMEKDPMSALTWRCQVSIQVGICKLTPRLVHAPKPENLNPQP